MSLATATTTTRARPRPRVFDIRKIISDLRGRHRSEDKLVSALVSMCEEDRDVLKNFARYVIRQMADDDAGRSRRAAAQPTPAQREYHRVEAKKVAQKVAAKVAERIVLDLVMPNGTRMRYCTGAQMKGFGDAYTRIGEKVGDGNLVGEIMTEEEAKALLCPL
jgi:hypothetical protein